MRQIKFRGKDIETGEWIYGSLVQPIGQNPRIYEQDVKTEGVNSFFVYEVEESTVGQFAELLDKNGNEIYDGDILVWGENDYKSPPMIVMFKHGSFGYTYIGDWFHSFAGNTNFTFNPLNTDVRFEIVGNIHDNPEILKNK